MSAVPAARPVELVVVPTLSEVLEELEEADAILARDLMLLDERFPKGADPAMDALMGRQVVCADVIAKVRSFVLARWGET